MRDPDELPRRVAAALGFCGRPLVWLEEIEVVEIGDIGDDGPWGTLIGMRASLRPAGPKYFGRTVHAASPEYVARVLKEGRQMTFVMTGSTSYPKLGTLCTGLACFTKDARDRATAEEIRRLALAPGGAATFAEIAG